MPVLMSVARPLPHPSRVFIVVYRSAIFSESWPGLSRPSTSCLRPLPTLPRARGRGGRGKTAMPATSAGMTMRADFVLTETGTSYAADVLEIGGQAVVKRRGCHELNSSHAPL